jgi:hypothetical protein
MITKLEVTDLGEEGAVLVRRGKGVETTDDLVVDTHFDGVVRHVFGADDGDARSDKVERGGCTACSGKVIRGLKIVLEG